MINAQHLQSSNVYAKVTSLLQYSHPWWSPKIGLKVREPINYGRFINQFPPDTIKFMPWLDKINTKMCRQRMSILFNQKCINEKMLPNYTHTHTHKHTHTHTQYIYISSSSSCRAASTDIPDPLSTLLPIIHRFWEVFRATSRILL